MQTDCIMWSSCCFEHDGLVGFRAIWRLQAQKFKSAPVEVVSQREPWGVMRWGMSYRWKSFLPDISTSKKKKQEQRRRQRRPSWRTRFLLYSDWPRCSTGHYKGHINKTTLDNNSIAALQMGLSLFSKMKMRWEMLWKLQNLLSPSILS